MSWLISESRSESAQGRIADLSVEERNAEQNGVVNRRSLVMIIDKGCNITQSTPILAAYFVVSIASLFKFGCRTVSYRQTVRARQ